MPPLPKTTGGFASLIMSDSEPDFDDVATIKARPSRENNQRLYTLKGSSKPQSDGANRVTKPAPRLERSHQGRRNDDHATARQTVKAQAKIRSSTSALNGTHKSLEQPASHDSSSPESHEARDHHDCKRPHDARDKPDHEKESTHSVDAKPAHTRNSQRRDAEENADATAASTGSREITDGVDSGVPNPTFSYDAGGLAAQKQSEDLRERYEALEARHKELRDNGVKAAECNFERLKRQSMETAAASTALIHELKAELANHSTVVKQNEQIRSQLERSQGNADELQRTVADLTASLSKAKIEIQSLSAKLKASRAAEAKATTSTINAVSGSARSAPPGAAAALAAQSKEDLYADLTGLIVRGTSQVNGENVFDCLQTGRNGTLHFKLALEASEDPEKYDDMHFTYKPQIDEERDRDLVAVLPDYLVEEITFRRTQASNFYSKLNKSLTERLG